MKHNNIAIWSTVNQRMIFFIKKCARFGKTVSIQIVKWSDEWMNACILSTSSSGADTSDTVISTKSSNNIFLCEAACIQVIRKKVNSADRYFCKFIRLLVIFWATVQSSPCQHYWNKAYDYKTNGLWQMWLKNTQNLCTTQQQQSSDCDAERLTRRLDSFVTQSGFCCVHNNEQHGFHHHQVY